MLALLENIKADVEQSRKDFKLDVAPAVAAGPCVGGDRLEPAPGWGVIRCCEGPPWRRKALLGLPPRDIAGVRCACDDHTVDAIAAAETLENTYFFVHPTRAAGTRRANYDEISGGLQRIVDCLTEIRRSG